MTARKSCFNSPTKETLTLSSPQKDTSTPNPSKKSCWSTLSQQTIHLCVLPGKGELTLTLLHKELLPRSLPKRSNSTLASLLRRSHCCSTPTRCDLHPLPEQEMILCWDTTTTAAVSGPQNSGAKAISVNHRHSYMCTHMLNIVLRGMLSFIILPHGGKSEQKDPSSESVNSHGREGRCPQAAGGNKTASDRLFFLFF